MYLLKLKNRVTKLKLLKKTSFVLIILTLILIFFNYIFSLGFNYIINSPTYKLSEPISLLFIGSDAGGNRAEIENYQPLADSIFVATINPNNSRNNVEINTISIPRDTSVEIACTGQTDKINSSFSAGGSQNESIDDAIDCTKQTVETLLSIDIDYYIHTSFGGLIELVDAIGGIYINVPYPFCEQDSNSVANAICLEEGYQLLNGEQALAYSRQRKAINPYTNTSGDDFERNIRQQEVISAVIKKILSNPTNYSTSVFRVLNSSMDTNLKLNDIVKLLNLGLQLYNEIITAFTYNEEVNIYLKSSDFARSLAISPYADLFGATPNSSNYQILSDLFTDDSNYYYMDYTRVFSVQLNNKSTKLPTHTNPDSKNPPDSLKAPSIEIQMETLDTTTDTSGSTQEIVSPFAIEYYTKMLQHSLNTIDSSKEY